MPGNAEIQSADVRLTKVCGDPSYGVQYTGACGTGGFELAAIAGYGEIIRQPSDEYPYFEFAVRHTVANTCNIQFTPTYTNTN